MRRIFIKLLSLMLVALLLPILLLPTYAQEQNNDFCDPSDDAVLNPSLCQHVFMITIDSECRYISETHHACYEVEIMQCIECGFTTKNLGVLLYTEQHELEQVDYYEIDESGEYIYYGICRDCNGYGHTTL